MEDIFFSEETENEFDKKCYKILTKKHERIKISFILFQATMIFYLTGKFLIISHFLKSMTIDRLIIS